MLLLLLGCAPDNTMVAAPGMPFELGEVASALFVSDYWSSQQDPKDSDEGLLVLSSFKLTCDEVRATRWRWDDDRVREAGNDVVVVRPSWWWYPFEWDDDTEPPGSLSWAGLYAQHLRIEEKAGEGRVRRDLRVDVWQDGTSYELDGAQGFLDIEGLEDGKVRAKLQHDLVEANVAARNCGAEEPEGSDSGYYY